MKKPYLKIDFLSIKFPPYFYLIFIGFFIGYIFTSKLKKVYEKINIDIKLKPVSD